MPQRPSLELRKLLAQAEGFLRARDLPAARGRLLKAVRLFPQSSDALEMLGALMFDSGRHREALDYLERAVAAAPDSVSALTNYAIALSRSGDHHDAVTPLEAAVRLEPANGHVVAALATVYAATGRSDEAIALFRKAAAISPREVSVRINLAAALMGAGDEAGALAAYEQAVALQPSAADALWGRLACQLKLCDWTDYDARVRRCLEAATSGPPLTLPAFAVKLVSDDAEVQLAFAKKAVQALAVPANGRRALELEAAGARIRVAYVGADFRSHATANLASGLFEAHDRDRFEVIAVSYGTRDAGDVGTRIEAAFDEFVDVSARSSSAIAAKLAELRPAIAVDLMGHTKNAKLSIFAGRPAPIQVSFLGFPGTTGFSAFDYLIADPYLATPDVRRGATEKLVIMPDCYQPNDDKKLIAAATPTRAAAGLPERAFVFACFNQSQKITPQMFAVWMRILGKVESSVLWLLDGGTGARDNLVRHADAAGVTPERLIFAPRLPRADHLARIALADLCLDTFPYTSHTTASDALWAGCPVLTCAGTSFASRVCGSLLLTVGLPELVTIRFEDFERRAVQLARDRDELLALRGRLANAKHKSALFDTVRYARNLERAFTEMVRLHRAGSGPRDIDVRALSEQFTPTDLSPHPATGLR